MIKCHRCFSEQTVTVYWVCDYVECLTAPEYICDTNSHYCTLFVEYHFENGRKMQKRVAELSHMFCFIVSNYSAGVGTGVYVCVYICMYAFLLTLFHSMFHYKKQYYMQGIAY